MNDKELIDSWEKANGPIKDEKELKWVQAMFGSDMEATANDIRQRPNI